MAEVYPSDNELLNLQTDSETGVEYIPTGTSPYYLQFRKLLYRLLLAARRANDLRVCDEGGLDIGVKGGKFWLGTELINYNGSSGNTLADDKDNIYVYLDSDGNLVIRSLMACPAGISVLPTTWSTQSNWKKRVLVNTAFTSSLPYFSSKYALKLPWCFLMPMKMMTPCRAWILWAVVHVQHSLKTLLAVR